MAELPQSTIDAVLRGLFSGQLYLGLSRGTPQDEETDQNYARRKIQLSEPRGEGARYVTNTEPIIFPAYSDDSLGEIDYATLSVDAEGGEFLWADVVDKPRRPLKGDMVVFAVGSLKIGVP